MSAEAPEGPALLCWDGSDGAALAIRHAARLLGPGHPALVLFAHVPTEAARGVQLATDAGFAATGVRIAAERKTSEIITELAEAEDVSVITMGQRPRSALGTLVLGSVAREVLGSFHRPVLLVGPGSRGHYPM